MLKMILLAIILFSSLGVFIKLRRYGAPYSSFIYSPVVPVAVLISSLKYGYTKITTEKKLKNFSKYKKIKIFILYSLDCIRSLSLLTGLFCIELGKQRIGAIELLEKGGLFATKRNTDRILNIIIKTIESFNVSIFNSKSLLKKVV